MTTCAESGDLVSLWSGPFGDAYTERNDPANTSKPPRRDIVREVVTTLEPHPLRLLEVGANIGLNVRGVSGIVPRIVAVDVNRGALEKLRRENPWVQTIVAPAQELPFLDDEFDLTVCIGLMIHIPTADLGAVMDELVRVTRQGGHILTGNYDAVEETVVPYHQEAGSEALYPRLWKRPYHALFREGRPVEPVGSKYLGTDEGWDRVNFDMWRRT